jgi:hypothetical protein
LNERDDERGDMFESETLLYIGVVALVQMMMLMMIYDGRHDDAPLFMVRDGESCDL